MPLTDLEVRRAVPHEKTYRVSDGRGMYLEISPSGGKYWRLKYRFNDRERKLALDVYPDVTLAHAGRKRDEARAMLADGIDPGQAKKDKKRLARLNAASTFEAVALEWFEQQAPGWAQSHSEKIMGRLKKDLFPWLGSRPIADISPPEVLRRGDRARDARRERRSTRSAAAQPAYPLRLDYGSREGRRDAAGL